MRHASEYKSIASNWALNKYDEFKWTDHVETHQNTQWKKIPSLRTSCLIFKRTVNKHSTLVSRRISINILCLVLRVRIVYSLKIIRPKSQRIVKLKNWRGRNTIYSFVINAHRFSSEYHFQCFSGARNNRRYVLHLYCDLKWKTHNRNQWSSFSLGTDSTVTTHKYRQFKQIFCFFF